MLDIAVLSNIGDRMINEDCVRVTEKDNELLIALADGLGGHGKGEAASVLVADTAMAIFKEREFTDSGQLLNEIFKGCQERLLLEQQRVSATKAMKATLVLCYVTKDTIAWGHIGDSRLYLFEHGRIVERTYDHSVPQMLVYAKKIKEKDIRLHADRNRLLKALGTEGSELEFELHIPIKRRKSHALLLCSDGFWELIDEKKMQQCMNKAKCAQEWLFMMEDIIRRSVKEDKDNYSAAGVWL